MNSLSYTIPKRIWLKRQIEFNEKWVQKRIAEDPSILGLGDVILKDQERAQPRLGRLDLLFQEVDTNRRYEVELQLGATDESHIIRTIEYWDIERKRYPQYDHVAVLVAEDITSRFLNVISLFNGFIPLVAIQLSALQINENIALVFTKVLDEIQLGLVDEDEEVAEVTDRAYWLSRGTQKTVNMVDELLSIVKGYDPDFELKYNKFYIGLAKNEQPKNFVIFRPQKSALRVEVRLPKSEGTSAQLEEVGLDVMDYDTRWGRYRIRLTPADWKKHQDILAQLIQQAHELASE
jgi:predicted transport protein